MTPIESIISFYVSSAPLCSDDWEINHHDESDEDRLTGLEDFGLLLRPLGLTEKKLVPDPIAFTEPDPLGATVYSSADPLRDDPKGSRVTTVIVLFTDY